MNNEVLTSVTNNYVKTEIKQKEKISFNVYLFFKRLFDIIFSLIGLILLIPITLIVKIIFIINKDFDSIFYVQRRTGKGGKEFNIYKFRSMTVDNDALNFNRENKETKVGKFIRKTSLDELPQLFNIFTNSMSFIGPRPWIPLYYENFTEEQKRRVEVKPGLTGLAQCKGRNGISVFEKIKYDIEYVDNLSFKMDLKIIILTIKCVLSRKDTDITKMGIKNELDDLRNNYLKETNNNSNI